MTAPVRELSPEKRAEIERMLRAGQIMPVIALRVGVARSTVFNVARSSGINYVRGRPGAKPGSSWRRKIVAKPAAVEGENWRARAASLRGWGSSGAGFGW